MRPQDKSVLIEWEADVLGVLGFDDDAVGLPAAGDPEFRTLLWQKRVGMLAEPPIDHLVGEGAGQAGLAPHAAEDFIVSEIDLPDGDAVIQGSEEHDQRDDAAQPPATRARQSPWCYH